MLKIFQHTFVAVIGLFLLSSVALSLDSFSVELYLLTTDDFLSVPDLLCVDAISLLASRLTTLSLADCSPCSAKVNKSRRGLPDVGVDVEITCKENL